MVIYSTESQKLTRMTSKLKEVKKPPLLNASTLSRSLWMEVLKEQLREVRRKLRSLADDNLWVGFTWQAVDLKELGLLTPNPDYGGVSTPPMPPIKEVGEG